eukprot:TRINITY_DN2739_c0_g1_i2.p1 TRINITY_DN2739_c0_g1~~TRINITY_DN2739_c0_g1_i2.p1  ORF type:complete len:1150 (+),score=263.91 TRINITY_DN2739_c0_g1_i2:294-3452(+)
MGTTELSIYDVVTAPPQFDLQLYSGSTPRGRIRFVLEATVVDGFNGFAQMSSGVYTELGVAFPTPLADKPLPIAPALTMSAAVAQAGGVEIALRALNSSLGDQAVGAALYALNNIANTYNGRQTMVASNSAEALLQQLPRYNVRQEQLLIVQTLHALMKDAVKTFKVRLGKKDHSHQFAKMGTSECFIVEEHRGVPMRSLELIRGNTYKFKLTTPADRVFYISRNAAGTTSKTKMRIFGKRTQEREDDTVVKPHLVDSARGVYGTGNYGDPGTLWFTPDVQPYHRSHRDEVYYAAKGADLQYMGGKITLLPASMGIRAHTQNALLPVYTTLQHWLGQTSDLATAVRAECAGALGCLSAWLVPDVRTACDISHTLLSALPQNQNAGFVSSVARWVGAVARAYPQSQQQDVAELLTASVAFVDDIEVAQNVSEALQYLVITDEARAMLAPQAYDFLLEVLKRLAEHGEVLAQAAGALDIIAASPEYQPQLAQKGGVAVLLNAVSRCKAPEALSVCLRAISHLLKFCNESSPSSSIAQSVVACANAHYTHDQMAGSCFTALANICLNAENIPIVKDCASGLRAEASIALAAHAYDQQPQQVTAATDAACSARVVLAALLLELSARASPVQLVAMFNAARSVSLNRNIASGARQMCLSAVIGAAQNIVTTGLTTPLLRTQCWHALAAAGNAIAALARDDAARDVVVASGGAKWLLERVKEALSTHENKKKEIPKKKDRNAHNERMTAMLEALGALSHNSSAMALRDIGAVELVLKVARVYSRKTSMLAAAVPIIAGLSSEPSVCQTLGEQGAVQMVLRTLRAGPTGALLAVGLNALLALCSLQTNRLIVVAYGGVAVLNSISEHSITDSTIMLLVLNLLAVLAQPGQPDCYPTRTAQVITFDAPFAAADNSPATTAPASAAPAAVQQKFDVRLQFSAKGLPKVDFFGKADPYLQISVGGGFKAAGYKTEHVSKELDPCWAEFAVSGEVLCANNIDAPLILEVYDWDRVGDHKLLATLQSTLRDLQSKVRTDLPLNVPPGGKAHKATLRVDMCEITR